MDLENALRDRRSIRQFLSRPVPEITLLEVLDLTRWSPSWANTQGWRIHVVAGPPLQGIKAAFGARLAAQEERTFEIPRPHAEWPPELAARTQQLMALRTAVAPAPAGFGLGDFFGAPCLLLVAIDERLQPEYACFDSGLLAQTLCLAAHAKGLGTCIMAMAVGYPEVLHQAVPAAAGQRFVVGVALGYPDLEAPINRFERVRAPLSEIVNWVK